MSCCMSRSSDLNCEKNPTGQERDRFLPRQILFQNIYRTGGLLGDEIVRELVNRRI